MPGLVQVGAMTLISGAELRAAAAVSGLMTDPSRTRSTSHSPGSPYAAKPAATERPSGRGLRRPPCRPISRQAPEGSEAMRRVTLGATGIETSALGFGAAGLGSRVGAEEGARALAEAFDGGVTSLISRRSTAAARPRRSPRLSAPCTARRCRSPPRPGWRSAAAMPAGQGGSARR